MNWCQKISQSLAEPEFTSEEQTTAHWDAHYPPAGSQVGGLTILDDVPNTNSIGASFLEYEVLPGIREVHDFGNTEPHEVFYSAGDIRKSKELAEQIRQSRQIKPLIVGIDSTTGPHIVEGIHRLVALNILNVTSFPALVVVDTGE
jgi:hypothetical protein